MAIVEKKGTPTPTEWMQWFYFVFFVSQRWKIPLICLCASVLFSYRGSEKKVHNKNDLHTHITCTQAQAQAHVQMYSEW